MPVTEPVHHPLLLGQHLLLLRLALQQLGARHALLLGRGLDRLDQPGGRQLRRRVCAGRRLRTDQPGAGLWMAAAHELPGCLLALLIDMRFCRTTVDRLSHAARSRLGDLVAGDEDGDESAGDQAVAGGGRWRSFFTELKPTLEPRGWRACSRRWTSSSGCGSWIFRLTCSRMCRRSRWTPGGRGRAGGRAAKEYPANLERMKPPMRLTPLAALRHVRHTEITDSLVELFIQLVLKINTRAEKKVDKEMGPLFWTHANPYGRFELDMNTRLDLDLAATGATVPGPRAPQVEAAAVPA
ncbi:hypothetical protein [Streptomyces sp. JH34]|uniref:hypothetical protein n=1 Tax=Streptomyces sp. JH34 TaxID=2793633 RepID=UPI0023FA44D1|nr:hypothetical protein [Streptomyces sp. JH34]MDF6016949.1 hypothetical protein [Streptomyces sp. JH34]